MLVLAAGLVPRGNLLKATKSQEESVHKALRHYITPVRGRLSMAGRSHKGLRGFTVRVQGAQTDRRGVAHLSDQGRKQCRIPDAHTQTHTQHRSGIVGEPSGGQWAAS